MSIIDNLNKILHATYGREVRQAIHDGIKECYDEGRAGSIDLSAREDITDIKDELEGVEQHFQAVQANLNALNTRMTNVEPPAYEGNGKATQALAEISALRETVGGVSDVANEALNKANESNAFVSTVQVDVQFTNSQATVTQDLSWMNRSNINVNVMPVLNNDMYAYYLQSAEINTYTIKILNKSRSNFNGTVTFLISYIAIP